MKSIRGYISLICTDPRPFEQMGPKTLNNYLLQYFDGVRKPISHERYEAKTLLSYYHALYRYLKKKNYMYDLKHSVIFNEAREYLHMRKKSKKSRRDLIRGKDLEMREE